MKPCAPLSIKRTYTYGIVDGVYPAVPMPYQETVITFTDNTYKKIRWPSDACVSAITMDDTYFVECSDGSFEFLCESAFRNKYTIIPDHIPETN